MVYMTEGKEKKYSLEKFVSINHPLRYVNVFLKSECFKLKLLDGALEWKGINYSERIMLVKLLVIQILYSIKNEKRLLEEISYSLLFRWFIGKSIDEEIDKEHLIINKKNKMIKNDIVLKLINDTIFLVKSKISTAKDYFYIGDEAIFCPFNDFTEPISYPHKVNCKKNSISLDFYFSEAINIIDSQYTSIELSINKIVLLIGCSRATLYRAFKNHEINIHQYINQLRIEHACNLLKIPSLREPIETIAFKSGFADVRSFNRVFKKLITMSPGEYREKHYKSFEQRQTDLY